jgi:hypothetical protein
MVQAAQVRLRPRVMARAAQALPPPLSKSRQPLRASAQAALISMPLPKRKLRLALPAKKRLPLLKGKPRLRKAAKLRLAVKLRPNLRELRKPQRRLCSP